MTRPRPRALMVALGFPPSRGSGVYRTRAWANTLAAAGWDVTVVTARRDWYLTTTGVDDPLAATVDPRVRIVRTHYGFTSYSTDLASMSWLHANFPRTHHTLTVDLPMRGFPEQHALWLPTATAAGARVGLRQRPDLVVATGNPYAGYAAARALARLFRVPYALDFHDAWTLNQVTGEPAYPAEAPAWAWERRVIDGAAMLVTVNEPLRAWYAEHYPAAAARFRVVENGWAPDVLGDVAAPRPAGATVRFGYVGTVRTDLPLEEFFAGWRLARRQPELAGATFDLWGYLDYFQKNAHRLRARLPLDQDGVSYRGPVSQTGLAGVYEDLDVLVSLLPSSRFVTSGKVYDYLATARPVVAVHSAATGATAVARDYPLWFGMDEVTPEAVASALAAAAAAARRTDAAVLAQCREVAAAHSWGAHLQPVVDELRELVR